MASTQLPPIDLSYLLATLTEDSDAREKVREAVKVVEKESRACVAVLNRVHNVDAAGTPALLTFLDPLLPPLRTSIATLASLIPPTQFYRYSDGFSRAMQTASFIVVLRRFLLDETVLEKEAVEKELGIDPAWADHFFLTIEEYLHSLISLLNELSRLAVNRVTLNDFDAPARYSRFAKELSSAFGLLNLKNDNLRKRFDGIKYDVKKLEEVVYDLSLRGLLSSGGVDATTGGVTRPADGESDGQGPSKKAKSDIS